VDGHAGAVKWPWLRFSALPSADAGANLDPFMALFSFSKHKKAVLNRCRDDYTTQMRHKYDPFYHAMDGQRGTTVQMDGKDLIMLSSNDYLGLAFHPKVIEAATTAMKKWGTSTNGARPSNGSRAFHLQLEEKIATFLGREACHVHAAGYLSCMSSIASFAQKGDVVFADKNIHSCLWDGIQITRATVERFSHNNPDDLRAVIAGAGGDRRGARLLHHTGRRARFRRARPPRPRHGRSLWPQR